MITLPMSNRSKLAQEFVETGRLSVPFIDAHTHMGPMYGVWLPHAELPKMIAFMDKENIESIVSAPHNALFDPLARNNEIVEAMAAYPDRVYGYYAVNPNYIELFAAELDTFDNTPGYVGFKLLPDYHKYPLTGDKLDKIYEFANERGVMLLSHTWGGSLYNAPRQVDEVAKKYPNIRILMGHSAPGETDAAIELATKYPNVYLELCDTGRLSGVIAKMVRKVGSEKVVFGTDFPWYDPNYMLGSVLFSGIGDEDILNIVVNNARRLIAGSRAYRTASE